MARRDGRGPRVAVSVTLSPSVLAAARRVADDRGVSRSALIEQALWAWMTAHGRDVIACD